MSYHVPVMSATCIELLNLRAGKVYVDATLGGGGHALAMYQKEPGIRLYAFDQDIEAIRAAGSTLKEYNPVFIHSNFSQLRTQLSYNKVKGIDGILFDLGVSSHQLDDARRGFSFDKDAALDMRMDTSIELDAGKLVNTYSVQDLAKIFKEYGEENGAGRIARAIEKEREKGEIRTTGQLARVIESVAGTGSKESLKTKVRIFQAIRIAVNDELHSLSIALNDAINLLNPGGRIVVMSYHSLEDRIVKNAFRLAATGCICPPAIIHCVCDHHKQLELICRKPITATMQETEDNTRSRSAKLRAAEKLMGEK
ncbi:MAG: 16S rRNA (cytosine(1402)-N(4))-methyltransferase RsmH [Candidatus Cloacimonetes bacterium]|nr:16S rRNA (cytosine(1402)-N(4))-methyltransferase RsmH [Candidatus Cloacimonadota bacterium]